MKQYQGRIQQHHWLGTLRTLLESAINPEGDHPERIEAIARLLAIGLMIVGCCLFLFLLEQHVASDLSSEELVLTSFAILFIGFLSKYLWKLSPAGWIGLKALLVFFMFTQVVDIEFSLFNHLPLWQYDPWQFNNVLLFIELGGDILVSFLAFFLISRMNHREMLDQFRISPTTRKVVDFMICLFVVCMLTIAFL